MFFRQYKYSLCETWDRVRKINIHQSSIDYQSSYMLIMIEKYQDIHKCLAPSITGVRVEHCSSQLFCPNKRTLWMKILVISIVLVFYSHDKYVRRLISNWFNKKYFHWRLSLKMLLLPKPSLYIYMSTHMHTYKNDGYPNAC